MSCHLKGAEQKSFPTIAEARQWLLDGGVMLMADGSFTQTGSALKSLQVVGETDCVMRLRILPSADPPIHWFQGRRSSAASGSDKDLSESETSEDPEDYEEDLTPSQAQPLNGPEALGRAVLLIEGLKVRTIVVLIGFLALSSMHSSIS